RSRRRHPARQVQQVRAAPAALGQRHVRRERAGARREASHPGQGPLRQTEGDSVMTDILVVGEIAEGTLRKNTLSAVRFARQVAEATGGAFDIVVVGEGSSAAADEAAKYGARKVLKAEVEGGYVAEKIAATVAQVAKDGGYGVVTATAGTTGKDLMPRVAAKLEAGVASDIASVSVEGDKLVYRRPMYAGNVFGYATVESPIQVVTVRQTEFEP